LIGKSCHQFGVFNERKNFSHLFLRHTVFVLVLSLKISPCVFTLQTVCQKVVGQFVQNLVELDFENTQDLIGFEGLHDGVTS
jgi:hypothetical protein